MLNSTHYVAAKFSNGVKLPLLSAKPTDHWLATQSTATSHYWNSACTKLYCLL